jgi:hypothetical protein
MSHRLAALAAAVLWTVPLMAQPAPPTPTLTVSADASVQAVPDLATVGAGVVTQAPEAAAALAANSTRMEKVIDALRKAGVDRRDIRTSQLSVQPQYRYGDNRAPQITGYQASNQVSVQLRDLARVGNVVDALVAQGANRIDGPSFSIADPQPLLDKARTAAVANARARADLLAKAAGVRIVRVLSIDEGQQPQPGPMPMLRMASAEAAPAPPVEAGETELRAFVTIAYEIAPAS